jgi:hypothetical protein
MPRSEEQHWKDRGPSDVTEDGIVIEMRPRQPTKARERIEMTEEGTTTDVSVSMPSNAR